jgi:hypothetical protein
MYARKKRCIDEQPQIIDGDRRTADVCLYKYHTQYNSEAHEKTDKRGRHPKGEFKGSDGLCNTSRGISTLPCCTEGLYL